MKHALIVFLLFSLVLSVYAQVFTPKLTLAPSVTRLPIIISALISTVLRRFGLAFEHSRNGARATAPRIRPDRKRPALEAGVRQALRFSAFSTRLPCGREFQPLDQPRLSFCCGQAFGVTPNDHFYWVEGVSTAGNAVWVADMLANRVPEFDPAEKSQAESFFYICYVQSTLMP